MRSSDQPPLPGMPTPPPRKHAKKTTTQKVRFTRYRPAQRVLCDDCIARIDAVGVASAPYPNAATWRIAVPGELLRLCGLHKLERFESDR